MFRICLDVYIKLNKVIWKSDSRVIDVFSGLLVCVLGSWAWFGCQVFKEAVVNRNLMFL
jgi:hypothetical protein